MRDEVKNKTTGFGPVRPQPGEEKTVSLPPSFITILAPVGVSVNVLGLATGGSRPGIQVIMKLISSRRVEL
jgi:hypothetical protein